MRLTRYLTILFFALPIMAQNVRWDLPVTTTQAQGGNLLPVYAVPGALVSFYNEPSGTLATTYNSASSISPCPTGAQVVLNGSATCASSADPYGNMGGWFQPGQYMATITARGISYNYSFTITGTSSIAFQSNLSILNPASCGGSTPEAFCPPHGNQDLAAWTNAATAYCASNGFGCIIQPSAGTYTVNTGITLTSSNITYNWTGVVMNGAPQFTGRLVTGLGSYTQPLANIHWTGGTFSNGTSTYNTVKNQYVVTGAMASGTFTLNETVTQTGTGATAQVIVLPTLSAPLIVGFVTGSPNSSGLWTGASSLATYQPTSVPVLKIGDAFYISWCNGCEFDHIEVASTSGVAALAMVNSNQTSIHDNSINNFGQQGVTNQVNSCASGDPYTNTCTPLPNGVQPTDNDWNEYDDTITNCENGKFGLGTAYTNTNPNVDDVLCYPNSVSVSQSYNSYATALGAWSGLTTSMTISLQIGTIKACPSTPDPTFANPCTYVYGNGIAPLTYVSATDGSTYVTLSQATTLGGTQASGLTFATGAPPNAQRTTVRHVTVTGAPSWECFDSHGASHALWEDVHGSGCYFGIQIGEVQGLNASDITVRDSSADRCLPGVSQTAAVGLAMCGKPNGYGLVFAGETGLGGASASASGVHVRGFETSGYGGSGSGLPVTNSNIAAVEISGVDGGDFSGIRSPIYYQDCVGLYGANSSISITDVNCGDVLGGYAVGGTAVVGILSAGSTGVYVDRIYSNSTDPKTTPNAILYNGSQASVETVGANIANLGATLSSLSTGYGNDLGTGYGNGNGSPYYADQGNGYTTATGLATVSQTGTGTTVNITATAGHITACSLNTTGVNNYFLGDTLQVIQPGSSNDGYCYVATLGGYGHQVATVAQGMTFFTSSLGTGAIGHITASSGALTSGTGCSYTSGGTGYAAYDAMYPKVQGAANGTCYVPAVSGGVPTSLAQGVPTGSNDTNCVGVILHVTGTGGYLGSGTVANGGSGCTTGDHLYPIQQGATGGIYTATVPSSAVTAVSLFYPTVQLGAGSYVPVGMTSIPTAGTTIPGSISGNPHPMMFYPNQTVTNGLGQPSYTYAPPTNGSIANGNSYYSMDTGDLVASGYIASGSTYLYVLSQSTGCGASPYTTKCLAYNGPYLWMPVGTNVCIAGAGSGTPSAGQACAGITNALAGKITGWVTTNDQDSVSVAQLDTAAATGVGTITAPVAITYQGGTVNGGTPQNDQTILMGNKANPFCISGGGCQFADYGLNSSLGILAGGDPYSSANAYQTTAGNWTLTNSSENASIFVVDGTNGLGGYYLPSHTAANSAFSTWVKFFQAKNNEFRFGPNLSSISLLDGSNNPIMVAPTSDSSLYKVSGICSSTASPAVCSSYSSGTVEIAVSATYVTVNTTAHIGSADRIFVQAQTGGPSACYPGPTNLSTIMADGGPIYAYDTPGANFTIMVPVAPATNPLCVSYWIVSQ